jgi:hypothetical protein
MFMEGKECGLCGSPQFIIISEFASTNPESRIIAHFRKHEGIGGGQSHIEEKRDSSLRSE